MKKIPVIILIICMVICLGGCEIKNINDREETTESLVSQDSEPQPYPIVIGGVTIEKTPERIVCLSPALTEILYEQGYGKSIIGRGSYCDYPPSAKDAPNMGSSANPDIEAIMSLKPELVLTASPIADKDLFRLVQNDIGVLVIPSPNSLTEFLDVYQAIGLMFEGMFTGKEKGESSFSEISKACDNRDAIDIGTFVYITENFSAATGDTLESAVLSCFGDNLAEPYSDYAFDLELLYENEPNFILVNSKYTLDSLYDHETLSEMKAVEEGRVIFIENFYFERPSARITEMIRVFTEDYKKLRDDTEYTGSA